MSDMGTVQVTTRLPKNLVEKIEEMAAKENRSRNNVIQLACQEYVERHERKEGKPSIADIDDFEKQLLEVMQKKPFLMLDTYYTHLKGANKDKCPYIIEKNKDFKE